MRTTVTLDDDVVTAVRATMKQRGVSFKEALNSMLRRAAAASTAPARPYRLRPRELGVRPGVDLTHANRLSADLEDEELARKLELGR